jgi:hypothetical protein
MQIHANTPRNSKKLSAQLLDADAQLYLVAQSLGLANWRVDPVRVCKELTTWPDLQTIDQKTNQRGKEAVLQLLKQEKFTEAETFFMEWCSGPELIRLPATHAIALARAPRSGDLSAAMAVLDKGAGKYDAFLVRLLVAGRFVGLTPHEWTYARLISGVIVFPDSDIPDYLAIPLHHVHPAGRHVVERVLQELADFRSRGDALPQLFKALGNRLYRVQKRAGLNKKKRMTLVSSRRSRSYMKVRHQIDEMTKSITREDLLRSEAALKKASANGR